MYNFVTKILYQRRKFIIGWSIGLFAMSIFMMLMYPALRDSDIGQLLQNVSPALEKLTGGGDSFTTADKYIRGEVFSLRMPLLLIVLVIVLFSGLIVGDERRGLLMSQLSLPISRTSLLLQKLLAAMVIIALVSAAGLLGVVAGLIIIGEPIHTTYLLQHMAGCALLAFIFGLVVLVAGAGFGRGGAATGLASGVAFVSYLVSSLVSIATVLEPFERFSLFHYYQNPTPVSAGHAALLLAVAAVLVVIGVVGFQRRDIG